MNKMQSIQFFICMMMVVCNANEKAISDFFTKENIIFLIDQATFSSQKEAREAIKDCYQQSYVNDNQELLDIFANYNPTIQDGRDMNSWNVMKHFLNNITLQAQEGSLHSTPGAFEEYIKEYKGLSRDEIYQKHKANEVENYKNTIKKLLEEHKYFEATRYHNDILSCDMEEELFYTIINTKKKVLGDKTVEVLMLLNRFFKQQTQVHTESQVQSFQRIMKDLLQKKIFTISQIDSLLLPEYIDLPGGRGIFLSYKIFKKLSSSALDKGTHVNNDFDKILNQYIGKLNPSLIQVLQDKKGLKSDKKSGPFASWWSAFKASES